MFSGCSSPTDSTPVNPEILFIRAEPHWNTNQTWSVQVWVTASENCTAQVEIQSPTPDHPEGEMVSGSLSCEKNTMNYHEYSLPEGAYDFSWVLITLQPGGDYSSCWVELDQPQ